MSESSQSIADDIAAKKSMGGCREDYPLQLAIPTRFNDYDLLGHINNAVYNRYFEIIVLELVKRAGVHWIKDNIVPFAAEVLVRFYKPLPLVDHVDAALKVGRLGRSSVTYEIALFAPGDDNASASGHFVHVFVDRTLEQPVPMPQSVRGIFEQYQHTGVTA